MRASLYPLALTVLVLTLSACGNKGDLYLRDPVAPPPLSAQELADAKTQAQLEAAQSGPDETQRTRRRRGRD